MKNVLILLFLLHSTFYISAKTIRVTTQQEFDNLSVTIKGQLDKGEKNVIVRIGKGRYFFKENHFDLEGWNYPDANLTIIGKGVTLTSVGTRYDSKNNTYNGASPHHSCWLDADMKEYNAWSHTYQSAGPIEILDREKGECRIKCDIPLPEYTLDKGTPKKVRITQWYLAEDYNIYNISGGYIYFTAHNLKSTSRGDNVNWDLGYGGSNPRFVIFNENLVKKGLVQVSNSKSNILYECIASCCINLNSTSLQNIRIVGISFVGNAQTNPLIAIRNFHGQQAMIDNCSFQYLHSKCVSISSSEHVTIKNCTFRDCQVHGITTDNNTSDTRVLSNKFIRVGKSLANNHVLTMAGKDFLIKGNYFEDFSYAACGVGVWYGSKKIHPCSGIIEQNEICYSSEYYNNAWKYTLMDAGAIYTFTKMDDVVIRYNYIHDYTGMKDYRGIFCDDGAQNIKIYGNVLHNIKGSYDIDLRYTSAQDVAQHVPEFNMHNQLYGNIMDGFYRFEGRPDADDDCIKNANYLISISELNKKNSIKNINNTSEDVYLEGRSSIELGKVDKKILKKTKIWKYIKKHIK